MTLEEQAIENLENFQEHYSKLSTPFKQTSNGTIAALTEIIIKQQKEIAEIKEYIENQKREAELASEDWN
jgi:hypothetical protein